MAVVRERKKSYSSEISNEVLSISHFIYPHEMSDSNEVCRATNSGTVVPYITGKRVNRGAGYAGTLTPCRKLVHAC